MEIIKTEKKGIMPKTKWYKFKLENNSLDEIVIHRVHANQILCFDSNGMMYLLDKMGFTDDYGIMDVQTKAFCLEKSNSEDVKFSALYLGKARNSAKRGIDFSITFNEYKKLITTKKCYYTGVALTKPEANAGEYLLATDRTIERLDNTKGYIKGNVVAVCYASNHIKSYWENPASTFTQKNFENMIKKLGKNK